MSALEDKQQRRRLAGELRRLRSLSGLSGRELGARIGLDQSTVSRIERADQRATLAQVVTWAKATEAPEDQQAAVLALAEDMMTGPRSWEGASETGSTDFAGEVAGLEARTGLLSNYQPAAFPGLLQTPAYARRVLSSGPAGAPADLAGRVLGRIDRQRVLYDEGKRFRFVIPEAVLRWPYGPPGDPAVLDEHREQLARAGWAAERPNVEVGILPLAPVAVWRTAGFVIFDEVGDGEPQVHLEWLTRPYNIFEPDQVETCRQAFANLMGASATGDEARRLIAAAASRLPPGEGVLCQERVLASIASTRAAAASSLARISDSSRDRSAYSSRTMASISSMAVFAARRTSGCGRVSSRVSHWARATPSTPIGSSSFAYTSHG